MAYAENTEIAVEKSIAEIVGLIRKAGADRIAQFEEPRGIAVQFFLQERMLRFRVTWPGIDEVPERAGNGAYRDAAQRAKILEQRKKQRARALLLVIKAKLESVESGVETFEEAFLANVVMPDGATVGEYALPKIAEAYLTGKVPPMMLPAP